MCIDKIISSPNRQNFYFVFITNFLTPYPDVGLCCSNCIDAHDFSMIKNICLNVRAKMYCLQKYRFCRAIWKEGKGWQEVLLSYLHLTSPLALASNNYEICTKYNRPSFVPPRRIPGGGAHSGQPTYGRCIRGIPGSSSCVLSGLGGPRHVLESFQTSKSPSLPKCRPRRLGKRRDMSFLKFPTNFRLSKL